MLEIQKNAENKKVTLALRGRLDTGTAPELEETLKSALDGAEELTFDLAELEYISSAGLRVLLSAQKAMNKLGRMRLTGVKEAVMEVFSITGFADILTIE